MEGEGSVGSKFFLNFICCLQTLLKDVLGWLVVYSLVALSPFSSENMPLGGSQE